MATYIFSASSALAQEHYGLSVANGYPLGDLARHLDVKTLAQLTAAYSDDRAYLWAGKHDGQDEVYWERMAPGDLVLGYRDRSIFMAAFIIATSRSAAIGDAVWGRVEERPYTLIYFFTRPHEFEPKPIQELNRNARYFGEVYQGLRRVASSEQIIRDFGSERRFVEEELTHAPLWEPPRLYDEFASDPLYEEGGKVRVMINRYERNPAARDACIGHWGTRCDVCGFDFSSNYGDIGAGFIEVHHLRELSQIGHNYVLNPVEDLRPVCSNCHSMLHRKRPAWTIDELRGMLRNE